MTSPNEEEKQLADAPAKDVVDKIKEKVREEAAREKK